MFPYRLPIYFFNLFFEAILQLFILQFWTKYHRQCLGYSDKKNVNTSYVPIISLKNRPFHKLFESKLLSLNGLGPSNLFDQSDSLSIKIKIKEIRHIWQKLRIATLIVMYKIRTYLFNPMYLYVYKLYLNTIFVKLLIKAVLFECFSYTIDMSSPNYIKWPCYYSAEKKSNKIKIIYDLYNLG